MRLTFWAVVFPFMLAAVQWAMSSPVDGAPLGAAVAGITAIWFVCGLPVCAVYWLVRLARRAWRDGSPRAVPSVKADYPAPDWDMIEPERKQPARAAGWIYPAER